MLRATMVIDYQNVHLTARDVFEPGTPDHESLIHPMLFAKRAVQQRNMKIRPGFPQATIQRVIVFRGLPHVDHDPKQHRRCLDQAAQWQSDGADVQLRDLKYDYLRGPDGKPVLDVTGKKTPVGRPKEKGIDVLCALACVREASRPDVDIVILASRDTDLVPVLDEIYDAKGAEPARYAAIETVAWYSHEARRAGQFAGGSLRPTSPRRIWNTNLDRACYEASLDRYSYR